MYRILARPLYTRLRWLSKGLANIHSHLGGSWQQTQVAQPLRVAPMLRSGPNMEWSIPVSIIPANNCPTFAQAHRMMGLFPNANGSPYFSTCMWCYTHFLRIQCNTIHVNIRLSNAPHARIRPSDDPSSTCQPLIICFIHSTNKILLTNSLLFQAGKACQCVTAKNHWPRN